MPTDNNTGKPGTITVEEFNNLASMATQYGEMTLAQKVSKICSRKAAALKHECPTSAVGAAYEAVAGQIARVTPGSARTVSAEAFTSLTGLVAKYGPEVVTWKLSKLARRNNRTIESDALKSVFPRSA